MVFPGFVVEHLCDDDVNSISEAELQQGLGATLHAS